MGSQLSSETAADGWMLLDLIDDEEVRVIGRAGRAMNRRSFERIIRERVKGRIGEAVGALALRRILTSRRDGKSFDVVVTPQPGFRTRLVGRTIVGPNGIVHGLHLWVGASPNAPTTRPPTAVAFTWDSDRRLAELPDSVPDILRSSGFRSDRRTFTAPEVFRHINVPDALSLISQILDPKPEVMWDGSVLIGEGADAKVAHVLMVSRPSPGEHVWRGLLHDVVSNTALASTSLESAALAAIPRVVPRAHMALLDLRRMRLIRWITDPLDGIQWKGMVDNRDTPHPEDVPRIFALAADVLTGKTEHAAIQGIRLRRFGGGWTVVDGAGALVPHVDGPKLGLVEFTVVGFSDDPDPVPVNDEGHAGLSVHA